MSNRSMLEDVECQTSRLHDRATKLLDGWDGMEDSNKKGERNGNSLLPRSVVLDDSNHGISLTCLTLLQRISCKL